VSLDKGVPWGFISRDQAIQTCEKHGYSLITNVQWQTIARNAEAQAENWTVRGVLRHGNCLCESGSGDACQYLGKIADRYYDGAAASAKFTLSNGEIIWDLSGNVTEWVSDDVSTFNISPILTKTVIEFTDTNFFPTSDTGNRTLFGPLNSSYNLATGVGANIAHSPMATIRRGGTAGDPNAGVFTARFNYPVDARAYFVGFRCTASMN